jgi:glutathione S-transferase
MVAEAIGDGPYILGQRYSVVDICLLMVNFRVVSDLPIIPKRAGKSDS